MPVARLWGTKQTALCLDCLCVLAHACCLLFWWAAAFLKHCMLLLLSFSVVIPERLCICIAFSHVALISQRKQAKKLPLNDCVVWKLNAVSIFAKYFKQPSLFLQWNVGFSSLYYEVYFVCLTRESVMFLSNIYCCVGLQYSHSLYSCIGIQRRAGVGQTKWKFRPVFKHTTSKRPSCQRYSARVL